VKQKCSQLKNISDCDIFNKECIYCERDITKTNGIYRGKKMLCTVCFVKHNKELSEVYK
jgi:hypothetical protein